LTNVSVSKVGMRHRRTAARYFKCQKQTRHRNGLRVSSRLEKSNVLIVLKI